MPGVAIIGAQWGDEGKGKVVDALASEADFVTRYSGGANAGHTIVVGNDVFKLHHLPCGTLHARPVSILGGGMAIDPWSLLLELEGLSRIRDVGEVLVSAEAHLVLPHHHKNDEGGGFVGTTGRGIGPAYSDKARRVGLRFGDLLDDDHLKVCLGRLLEAKPNSTRRVGWSTVEAGFKALDEVRNDLIPLITDTGRIVRQALKDGKRVLFEGGQGTMLDLGYGTYPFVTSSHPTVGGILVGAGVSHQALDGVYGVVKAFTTRVGHGPFLTEITDAETALRLRGTGKNQWDEYGTTTGRPRRVGWLDLVQLRYAAEINGFDGLVVTKLDVLSGFNGLRVCVAYKDSMPVYESIPCWGELRGLGSRAALPKEVTDYLSLIEDFTGVPVVMFSTSPDREDTFGEVIWE
jgi:adenylosuccinate synthase